MCVIEKTSNQKWILNFSGESKVVRSYFILGTWIYNLVTTKSGVLYFVLYRKYSFLVSFQEWPEEAYPSYANGPGYVISSDIARYIVSEFDNQTLRVNAYLLDAVQFLATECYSRRAEGVMAKLLILYCAAI